MITEKQLDEILARRKGTTIGKWRPLVNGTGICQLIKGNIECIMKLDPKEWSIEDQKMISFDHEDVPLLVAEIRRLRRKLQKCSNSSEN